MKIWNMPIEPLEERYSIQWRQWWEDAFLERGVDTETVLGTALTTSIETGAFLDCHGTVYWKSTQMANLVSKIKSGEVGDDDVIFFHDLWSPGIEALGYIRDISGAKFRVAGYLHAGAYDPADLLHQVNMQRWVTGIEQAWLKMFDAVFVGSRYHKNLLTELCPEAEFKIHPIGYPVKKSDIIRNPEKPIGALPIVVFPHRLDPEKNPQLFDALAEELQGEATFVKSKDVCTNKEDYYNLLAISKVAVSFADQETFGIAMVESALAGCIPVTPAKLSYLDTMPGDWQFEDFDGAVAQVQSAIKSPPGYAYGKEFDYSVSEISRKVLEVLKP